MAGFAWGSLGWLFVPDAQVNNLMVMTSFAGALAYSAVSNVYDLRAFYSSVGIATVVLLSLIHIDVYKRQVVASAWDALRVVWGEA